MIAVVYDVKTSIAEKAAVSLEEKGWTVIRKSFGEDFADSTKEAESIDMLLICAETQDIPSDGDLEGIGQFITDHTYDVHRLVQAYIPLLKNGEMKRIALISEEGSSVRRCRQKDDYAKRMLLAGLHMKYKMLFNKYREQGISIRCFALSDQEMENGTWTEGEGLSPVDYFCMKFSDDPEEVFMHSEENNFVMRNKWFEEVEW